MATAASILGAYPTLLFTLGLGVAILYWLSVIAGALDIDLLDGGADGPAADGVDFGHDGGAGGDLSGADGGTVEGHDGSHGHTATAHAHDGGGLDLLGALRLRSVPITVSLSIGLIFAWVLSVLFLRWIPDGTGGLSPWITRNGIFVFSILLALPATGVAVRPLARVFDRRAAAGASDLVGRVCIIRTGTASGRFGEATVEDGGAGHVVRVALDPGVTLKRGDEAVILSYDPDEEVFLVAPADELLKRKV